MSATGPYDGKGAPLTNEEKLVASYEHTLAKLQNAIDKQVLGGMIDSLYYRIHTLKDESRGFFFHPAFRDVLIDKYQEILLSRISDQLTAAVRERTKEEATNKIANLLVEKAAAAERGYGGEELKGRARELAVSLGVLAEGIDQQTEGIRKILVQVDRFRNLEFVRGVIQAGALTFVRGEGALRALQQRFAEYKHELGQCRARIEAAVAGDPGQPRELREDAIRAAMAAAHRLAATYFPDRARMSMATADAYADMTITIETKMIEAYVYKHKVPAEQIEAVRKVAEDGRGVLETLFRAINITGFFLRVFDLSVAVSATAAVEAKVAKAVGEFKKEKPGGSLFEAFNESPDMLFTRMQGTQQAALDIFISTLGTSLSAGLLPFPGIAEGVMLAFDGLTRSIRGVISTYLKRRAGVALGRIKKDREKLKGIQEEAEFEREFQELWDEDSEKVEELESALRATIQERSEKVGEGLAKMLRDAKVPMDIAGFMFQPSRLAKLEEGGGVDLGFDPGFSLTVICDLLSNFIVPKVTEWVLAQRRITPAEYFTGDDLTILLTEINFAQLPVGHMLQQSWRGNPQPAEVDKGKYAGLVPAEIKGHPVIRTDGTRSRLDGTPDSRVVYAALALNGAKVWGKYRPADGEWEASDLTSDAFADWSEIFLIDRETVQRDDQMLHGSWHAIVSQESSYTYIGFRTKQGHWLLGHFMDMPNGPTAPEYGLGRQTEKYWYREAIGDVFRI